MEAPWHTVEFAVSDGIRTPTGAASRSAPSCPVCDHSLPSTAIIRQQLFAAEQTKQPRRTGQPRRPASEKKIRGINAPPKIVQSKSGSRTIAAKDVGQSSFMT